MGFSMALHEQLHRWFEKVDPPRKEKVKHYKSKEAYRKSTAYVKMHDIPTTHPEEAIIAGHEHKIEHEPERKEEKHEEHKKRKGRFVKGSPEAKAYMHKLLAMRKEKNKK